MKEGVQEGREGEKKTRKVGDGSEGEGGRLMEAGYHFLKAFSNVISSDGNILWVP
jgi:hypothetical protein